MWQRKTEKGGEKLCQEEIEQDPEEKDPGPAGAWDFVVGQEKKTRRSVLLTLPCLDFGDGQEDLVGDVVEAGVGVEVGVEDLEEDQDENSHFNR